MHNYKKAIDLSNELISSVRNRDALLMQQQLDALDLAYREEFGDYLDSFESMKAFVLMNLASAKYFSHNNMFSLVHCRFKDVAERIEGFLKSRGYSDIQKAEVKSLFDELESVHVATPERHQNMVVNRLDTRCCLCRELPANKTGSHMVPNFLAHPTFSWDGKGKRFHEALNHDFLNAPDENCQYYGREVPEWRFAKGEGKEEVSEEDIEKNINQLEYDNEFCSHCEDRFGALESAYSQFYNGQVKKIHPRVAYLFWLSVLWRMSMGSMSIFMDMEDELALGKLLNDNLLDSVKEIEDSETDLAEWQYAIYKADGLRDGDKGILGYRKPCSPYVVMYNDLVMVFYHSMPSDGELNIGPITVKRELLNNWHSPEKSTPVDRRWFWDVRDWFVESSYSFYDPPREEALITVRELERSEGRIVDDKVKDEAIKIARIKAGPQGKQFRLRKLERITAAWMKKKQAEEKGEEYDPLQDEELFLQQRDFNMYYKDLAALSQLEEHHDHVPEMPFYKEARKAISDDNEWKVQEEDETDKEFMNAMEDYFGELNPFRSFAKVGRNDPCPCGSGKKYKNCHGRRRW